MMKSRQAQPIENPGLANSLNLSDENNRTRFSLMRVAKIASALALTAGAVVSLDVEENIVHYDPNLLDISPSMLPVKLPRPVRAMEKNVLQALEAIDADKIQVSGTGIQLNNNTLITAGHVFRNGKGNMFPDSNYCYAFTAISPRGFFRGVSQSSMYSDNFPVDIAVLKTKPLGKVEGSINTVRFADNVYIGEPLYFINYQTTPKGNLRPPSISSNPAIYGGVVESYNQNGDLNVPTVRSYGIGGDYDARPASSGGPVFNGDGELVGVVDQIHTPGPTVKKFSSVLGHIGLNRLAGNMEYTDAIVEPVSQEMIDNLEAIQVPFNCKN